jgi:SpoIIAA-like
MLELIEGLPGNIVGIAVSGRLTKQDCEDLLVPAMEKSLRRHEKIRLYYELNSRFPGAAWDELDLGLKHATRCERVAIVTDIGWVRLTVKALRFLIPSEIRVFATIEADEGRAWIKARREVRADIEPAPSVRMVRGTARRARRSLPARPRPRSARKRAQAPLANSVIVDRMESTNAPSSKFAPIA